MKILNTLLFLTILAPLMAYAGAPPETLDCLTKPPGATASHRSLLPSGRGYGFCTIDACDTAQGFDTLPYKNHCVKAPVFSWISKNQSVTESEQTLIIRGQLSRPASTAFDASLSFSGTNAEKGTDYDLPSNTIHFAAGSTSSDAFLIKIHSVPGYQPSRQISMSVTGDANVESDNSILQVTIIDTQTSAAISYQMDSALVSAGQTADVRVTFSQPLSRLFPLRLTLVAGTTSASTLLMPGSVNAQFSVPTSSSLAAGSYSMSVKGYATSSPGTLTVSASQVVQHSVSINFTNLSAKTGHFVLSDATTHAVIATGADASSLNAQVQDGENLTASWVDQNADAANYSADAWYDSTVSSGNAASAVTSYSFTATEDRSLSFGLLANKVELEIEAPPEGKLTFTINGQPGPFDVNHLEYDSIYVLPTDVVVITWDPQGSVLLPDYWYRNDVPNFGFERLAFDQNTITISNLTALDAVHLVLTSLPLPHFHATIHGPAEGIITFNDPLDGSPDSIPAGYDYLYTGSPSSPGWLNLNYDDQGTGDQVATWIVNGSNINSTMSSLQISGDMNSDEDVSLELTYGSNSLVSPSRTITINDNGANPSAYYTVAINGNQDFLQYPTGSSFIAHDGDNVTLVAFSNDYANYQFQTWQDPSGNALYQGNEVVFTVSANASYMGVWTSSGIGVGPGGTGSPHNVFVNANDFNTSYFYTVNGIPQGQIFPGNSVTINDGDVFEIQGYSNDSNEPFLGYTESTSQQTYQSSDWNFGPVTSDLNFYAQWAQNQSLSINDNANGDVTYNIFVNGFLVTSQGDFASVPQGEEIEIQAQVNNPNCQFQGYTASGGSYDSSTSSDWSFSMNADTIVQANWDCSGIGSPDPGGGVGDVPYGTSTFEIDGPNVGMITAERRDSSGSLIATVEVDAGNTQYVTIESGDTLTLTYNNMSMFGGIFMGFHLSNGQELSDASGPYYGVVTLSQSNYDGRTLEVYADIQ